MYAKLKKLMKNMTVRCKSISCNDKQGQKLPKGAKQIIYLFDYMNKIKNIKYFLLKLDYQAPFFPRKKVL